MSAKSYGSEFADQLVSRRSVVAASGLAAASLILPAGLIRAQAVSFDYYISPNGADSNPGTMSQPWALTALNTKRGTYAGKRVGLLDGTYDMVSIFGQPFPNYFDTNIITVAGGSASSPTIIQAVNPRQAVIDGNRPAVTQGYESGLIGPGGDFVIFDGLRVIRANYRAVINDSAGDDFDIRNCDFYDQVFEVGSGGGKNSSAVFMNSTARCTISNCRFEKGGAPVDAGRHAYIQFYGSSDVVVEFCTLIGSQNPRSGNGIHFKETGNRRMTVRYCYIDCSAYVSNSISTQGIAWHGNGGTDGYETCHNNVIVMGYAGACLYSEGASNTWRIYNNTFVGRPGYAEAGIDRLETGNPMVNIYDNIFSRDSYGYRGDINVPSVARIDQMDRNLYDSGPALKITVGSGSGSTGLAGWRAASGKDGSSVETPNAGFLNTGSGAARYQLGPNSPAKTLGTGGSEIGAWASAQQIGCSFGSDPSVIAPEAPTALSAI